MREISSFHIQLHILGKLLDRVSYIIHVSYYLCVSNVVLSGALVAWFLFNKLHCMLCILASACRWSVGA